MSKPLWKSHPCDGPHLDETLNALAAEGYELHTVLNVGATLQSHPLNQKQQTLIPFLIVIGKLHDPAIGLIQ